MINQSSETAPVAETDPLDPALLHIQARVRRLMMIGGLTLALGIFAVFAAILYKIVSADATPEAIAANTPVPTVSLSAIGLPADARLVSTALDGDRLALTYETATRTEIVILNTRTGAVAGRMALGR